MNFIIEFVIGFIIGRTARNTAQIAERAAWSENMKAKYPDRLGRARSRPAGAARQPEAAPVHPPRHPGRGSRPGRTVRRPLSG
jgi:hypothetical protein